MDVAQQLDSVIPMQVLEKVRRIHIVDAFVLERQSMAEIVMHKPIGPENTAIVLIAEESIGSRPSIQESQDENGRAAKECINARVDIYPARRDEEGAAQVHLGNRFGWI